MLCGGEVDGVSRTVLTAFRKSDLAAFKREIEAMRIDLGELRSATLWGVDAGVVLTLRAETAGRIIGEFVIHATPALGTARLHGQLRIDQSYLPMLADQCTALLSANYVGE